MVRAVHANNPSASRPFVAVHCAAPMETLVESELFGNGEGVLIGA